MPHVRHHPRQLHEVCPAAHKFSDREIWHGVVVHRRELVPLPMASAKAT